MNAEERAMKVWCEAGLAVAGGNVVAHRKHIAQAIREAQREVLEACLDYIEEEWFAAGSLIAPDGKDFLGDVRSAVGEVIGIGE